MNSCNSFDFNEMTTVSLLEIKFLFKRKIERFKIMLIK